MRIIFILFEILLYNTPHPSWRLHVFLLFCFVLFFSCLNLFFSMCFLSLILCCKAQKSPTGSLPIQGQSHASWENNIFPPSYTDQIWTFLYLQMPFTDTEGFWSPFCFSFYRLTCGIWKLLGQLSTWSLSCRPQPQPQQCQIQAAYATCTAACSNTWSLTHWARPGIKPESSWILDWFLTAEPQWELQELPFIALKFFKVF